MSLGLWHHEGDVHGFHGHASGQVQQLDRSSASGRFVVGFNGPIIAVNCRVVAYGAPCVMLTKAGRSSGCPAMEPTRAQRLLPELADGAMVFLFAPNENWLANDPWINGSAS